jgi:hypothetical protein
MRTLLILFLLTLCLTTTAQVFNTGVILGISGAQVEGDGYGGYKKLGFIGGGFVNTNLSKKMSAQFEIYFINKGAVDLAHPDKGDFDSFSLNLNYIEIPVSLRYNYHKFMLEIGLYYGQLIGVSIADEFGPREVNRFPFKSYDFGGLIGIYYQLNDHFIFNFRSKNSIIPIRDFQNYDQNVGILNKLFNRGWYNVDLNLSVRYQFRNKKNVN